MVLVLTHLLETASKLKQGFGRCQGLSVKVFHKQTIRLVPSKKEKVPKSLMGLPKPFLHCREPGLV